MQPQRHNPDTALEAGLDRLRTVLFGRRTLVLSGAGLSTESGIPDYRGPDGRARHAAPVTYQAFVRDERVRRRYWARSAVGWPRMAGARPNAGHLAVARLERAGAVAGTVTQNVDGLHGRAGSRAVVELHGALRAVRCLACGHRTERSTLQRRLLELNPWLAEAAPVPAVGPPGAAPARGPHLGRTGRGPDGAPPAVRSDDVSPAVRSDGAPSFLRPDGAPSFLRPDGAPSFLRPDGDAEVPDELLDAVRVPGCRRCGGTLKPDVVFFGENIPAHVAQLGWDRLGEAEAVLVLGSSLAVRSAYRLVAAAAEAGTPVAIVNDGPTRGDALASVRVAARLGAVLPPLAARWLGGAGESASRGPA